MKYAIVIALSILFLFPLYWMVLGSFQPIEGIMRIPPAWIPRTVTVENYTILLGNNPWLLWAANSAGIACITVILSVTVTVLAGYAFSMYRFPGASVLFWLFMASLMVSRQILIIPMLQTVRTLGLSGTRLAVILPLLFSPLHIFLFRRYLDRIPRDYIDSARIDGATELGIITRIVAPLCKPILGAIAIFVFVGVLNDFLWQMLVLQDANKRTLLVGIVSATHKYSPPRTINPIGRILAGGVVLALPQLAVFLRFQRYFVKGLQVGGIKE